MSLGMPTLLLFLSLMTVLMHKYLLYHWVNILSMVRVLNISTATFGNPLSADYCILALSCVLVKSTY
ncbi:MAG: hypothetical protein EXX96DRAFT_346738 [Benjaminiella poitrasii]|nr:MAG: hypothetical protein EXX96DRAFT_346738 [Benjaminiella poitrasii]